MPVFLASRSFSQEITIHTSIDVVREFISKIENLNSLNPLVISCAPVAGTNDQYIITDRLHFWGIPYKLRYRARIGFSENSVDSEIWAPLHFHHLGKISVEAIPDGTLVRETVEMDAPRLLANYALRNAEQAHREMLSRLKQRLEQR